MINKNILIKYFEFIKEHFYMIAGFVFASHIIGLLMNKPNIDFIYPEAALLMYGIYIFLIPLLRLI